MAKIAFLGVGIMGTPMVLNLLKAGHQVQVWSRSADKLQRVLDAGATQCSVLSDLAADADALVCMLSDGPTCDQLLFEQGAVSKLQAGRLLLMMSSIPVETAQAQAKQCALQGIHYLDAPVSGGEKGAIAATLAIMVGGAAADFEQAQPIFRALGHATHVGGVGCGELSKLVNQMIVASTIATVAEGLLLAQQGGANPHKVREALMGGFADSPILKQHGERMLQQSFQPGGAAKTQFKDTQTATRFAQKVGLNLPVAETVNQLFRSMVQAGDGDLDHSGLIREIMRNNGLTL